MNATRTIYGYDIDGVPHVPLQQVLDEREACLKIADDEYRAQREIAQSMGEELTGGMAAAASIKGRIGARSNPST